LENTKASIWSAWAWHSYGNNLTIDDEVNNVTVVGGVGINIWWVKAKSIWSITVVGLVISQCSSVG
jgi:hypothetical protein